MTKRQGRSGCSVSTRFKSGQSGNPKGRPRKPKPPAPSPFAILDELFTVHEPEGVSELPLEDAMLIKTYQRASLPRRRNPQVSAALGPGARKIGMGQSFALITEQQHDVASIGLRLEQLQTQPAAIDRLGVLATLQRVTGSPIAKAPFCAAPWKVAISRSSRPRGRLSHQPNTPASS